MEEDIQTVNTGVSVQKKNFHNAESGENNSTMVLVCFPRADAGLRARKTSISSIADGYVNSKMVDMKRTTFVNTNNDIELRPGENSFIVRSEVKNNFFVPKNTIFIWNSAYFPRNNRLKLKDSVTDSKIDQSFHNPEIIGTFLPDFLLGK